MSAPLVQLFGCLQQRGGGAHEQGPNVPLAPVRGLQRRQDLGGHESDLPPLAGPLLTLAGQRKLATRLRRADLSETARLTAADAVEMVLSSAPPRLLPACLPWLPGSLAVLARCRARWRGLRQRQTPPAGGRTPCDQRFSLRAS